jgi:hypothetical protein
MSGKETYAQACIRARAARARLHDSLSATGARITPARLKADLRDKTVQGVVEAGRNVQAAVRSRPLAASAAGIAFIAYLARRPLGTLFHRLFVRIRDRREDRHLSESETDNG